MADLHSNLILEPNGTFPRCIDIVSAKPRRYLAVLRVNLMPLSVGEPGKPERSGRQQQDDRRHGVSPEPSNPRSNGGVSLPGDGQVRGRRPLLRQILRPRIGRLPEKSEKSLRPADEFLVVLSLAPRG